MERLISQITNQFVNSDIQQIDAVIDSALKQIGQVTEVDRITMLEFNATRSTLKVTHEWCATNFPSLISKGMDHFEVTEFEKIRIEFKKDSFLVIPDCAQIDKLTSAPLFALTNQLNVKTLLFIPLVSRKHSYGLLFLQSIENLKNWDEFETDRSLLKMLGEIFSIVHARKSSEQLFYTSFTNSSNMMVIIRKADLKVLNVNPVLLKTLEYNRDEMVGRSGKEVSVFADPTERNQMMVQFNRDDYVKNYEITLKTKSGKLIYSYHTMETIQINGEECMLCTIQDISSLKLSEQSLRKEKERFQLVLESLPIPMVISDNEERNIYANPKFTEILGYSIEDVPDTDAWDKVAYPDKDYLKIIEAKAPEVTTTLSKPRINEVTCKNGSKKQIVIQDIAISDQEFISIFEDVTEKLEIEEHLKESQQRFQKIVEYFPYPIVATRMDASALYVNPAFSRTFGYTLEEIPTNEEWVQRAYPDPLYLDQIRIEVEHPDYSRTIPRERHITCKNGEVKICLLQEIQIGAEEITIFQEITAQRQAEKKMQEKDQAYRDIVENARDLIFIIDNNVAIQRINPACTEILGYSEEEMIGKSAFDFILPDFHALVKSNITLKQEHKKKTTLYEIDLRKKDGGILSVELFSRLIYKDKGKGKEMSGILAICRDISIRKRISEERFRERKIESIGLLAGGIAHDFNNILVSIVGNINLLQMDGENLTAEQKGILHDLEQGSLQARDLTKQLLTFSKGGVPIKKPESIEDVIRESAQFILRGSKAKCTFHFSPDLPPVDIDAGQINQVLNNLLINSSQAMPNGGLVHISAFLETVTMHSLIPVAPGPYVKVTIEDTGHGIPKSIQHNIFDPYFTTKKTGTGLGLTMSYSIITKHRGFITFSSVEGQGTTFYLYLPVTEKTKAESHPDSLEKNEVSSGKVLILDDEKNIHTLLRRVFTRFGIQMESCYDGTEVLQKLRIAAQEDPFDLIFMDLTIPGGMGGREAVKIVRNAYQDGVKIIVMSGYSNDPIIANFQDYGFDDYLEKPFTINQLQALLEKWITKLT
jgi:PAS domain S-box-containing protein